MAEYNISCLLTYITPPTVGWRENVAAAVEDGGIASIIDVLAKHGSALDMVKQATNALSGLAISRDNAGKVAEAGGIETALKCMSNLKQGKEEEMIIDSGAKLIETVARFNPESVVKAPTAVQSMLEKVGDERIPRVQTASAKVLDRIGMIDDGLQVIVMKQGISKLVDAISPEKKTHEGMLRPILRLLERLTKNPEFVKMIRQCNGVEALVAQLEFHSGNEFIKRAGGRLLAKIADGDIEETIRRMGMNLPDSVKQHLVGLLANLALQPENVEKIVAKRGIEALLKGFDNYNPATQAAALRALTRIAETGVVNVNKLLERGALAKIIDSLRTGTDAEVLKAATQALTAIAAVGIDHANLVFEHGGVAAVLESMMKFADEEHEGFAIAGLEFIDKLCSVDFPVVKIVQAGAVDAILTAMKKCNSNPEVQEKGFKALTGLVSSKDEKGNKFAAETIGQHKDLAVIPTALYNHKDKKNVVVAGVETLSKLAAFESVKNKLAEKGSLDALVAAAYEQMKAEMLGQSRISGDANYVRNVKALIGVLVSKSEVIDLPAFIKKAEKKNKNYFLQRTAVFALSNDFAHILLENTMSSSLKDSLDAIISEAEAEPIVDHCVATWSLAKSGVDAMNDLYDHEVPKSILAAAKTNPKLEQAVIACLRSLLGFASNVDLKERLVTLGTIEACVTAIRSNPQSPEVCQAAIDLLLALASTDSAASQIVYKGGVRQINKMIKDSSTSLEFEKAVEKAMKLLYRVANVDQSDVKELLTKQDTVNTVTIAMSAFPTNSDIIEMGARILAILMDEEDVANAIDEVAALTTELRAKKQDKVFEPLGQKAATVGFLSLNPKNLEIMQKKNAKGVTQDAINESKKHPLTAKREVAVMNEYRALGQISSVVGADKGTISELLSNLMAPEDIISLTEKVGILEAIKYMSSDPAALNAFQDKNAIGSILDLLGKNRSDEKMILSALDALQALMSNEKGIDLMTKAGGHDLIFGILRDDADNLKHKEAASALLGLTRLATREDNATKFVNDGGVDIVASTLTLQAEQSEEPRPKVLGAATKFLHQLLTSSEGKEKENVADQIVMKGVMKKVMDISQSSPEYLADGEVMQDIGNLLDDLTMFPDLVPKLREMGAVELMMNAINNNPGNENLETLAQKILQKLVGGDKNALEQTLKEYDRILDNVKRRKEANLPALERLNRAGVNLGNLMMVEGVVDAKGAKAIVERALETYTTVDKIPSNERTGPVKEQILDTALTNIGRSNLIDGAMNEVDMNKVLNVLQNAMDDFSTPQLQVQALNALAKLLNEDERALAAGLKFGVIKKLDDIMLKSASPEVKEAARKAMEIVREGVMNKPDLIVQKGPAGDADLAALLNQITDPDDLNKLLQKITDTPYGADALMRLAMGDLGGMNGSVNLSPELRKALLKALAQAPPGVLKIPPELIKDIVLKLNDPTVDSAEKAALLRLVGETKMTPALSKALIDANAPESLMDLLKDENIDPNLALAALSALAAMGKDPTLSNQLLFLDGANTIVEVMKRNQGNKNIQEQGFNTLANLKETVGPQNFDLSSEALGYLQDAVSDLDAGRRRRADQLVNDLANLYNGEMGPMVVQKFDNMLDVLNAGKDWRELHDPKTGKPYYYNVVTKETTWKKPQVLINAENALRNLQQMAEKRPADIDGDKLKAAIGLFQSQSAEPLRLKALAKALGALASNEKNRDAMVKHGVLKALIDALKGKNVDREFILAAIALLNQFAKHKVYKEMICDIGGIKALIKIMLTYRKDEEIVEKCEQCLANLAFQSPKCTQEFMDCSGVSAVGHVLAAHVDSIPVNKNGMSLLSNVMFKNANNKQIVGDQLRDRIIAILRRHYKDVGTFIQTGRTLGNIAFIDDHIRHVVRYNTVRSLIVAIEFHKGKKEVLQLGIDVIRNLASVDEDEFQQDIREGRMVSVVSTIWHEGGAKKIVDTFGETSDPKLVASCTQCLLHLLADVDVRRKLIGMNVVHMLFSAMQKYDWDTDIASFCIEAIEVLSDNHEGVQSIFENDGVSTLLQQMELSKDKTDFVLTVTKTLSNMGSLTHHHKEVSTRVLHSITQQGGIDTIIRTIEANVDDERYIRTAMSLLTKILVADSSISHEMATKGMRHILSCVQKHEGKPNVLISAYQLIAILAFEPKNLKIIVQFGGITLIVNSILNFPENDALVKRSVETLAFIAMGSEEHSNIVKDAKGEDVIQELIKTYETIPGEKAKELVKACKAALLTMNKIETRKLNKKLFFTEDREATDLAADPLRNFRTILKTGEVMTLWKKGRATQVHLLCKEKSYQLNWKVPGKNKVIGKLDLKNFVNLTPGKHTHGKKADTNNCFALHTTDIKTIHNFECKNPQSKTEWVEALEALRKVYRGNQKKWLEI